MIKKYILFVISAISFLPLILGCTSSNNIKNDLVSMDKQQMISEADIRKLIYDHIKGIRNKDLEGVMSIYAKDIVSFDIDPPLWYKGIKAKREAWANVFEMYYHKIDYEIHDLGITVDGDIAFSHSLNHISGTMKDGHRSDIWLRWTACFRKINGNWLVTHEQVSVPVDFKTGKALLDLKP